MEVGAIGVVAFYRFDKGGAIFGCAVGGADVAAVVVEAVES